MDYGLYLRFLATLVFVLGLIGVIAWAARRFGLGGKLTPNRGRNRRLSVVEVVMLDSRRERGLGRRDRTEHLVLLGAGQDLLLESGIAAPEAPASGANGGAEAPSPREAAR